jgi:hypothetical protein
VSQAFIALNTLQLLDNQKSLQASLVLRRTRARDMSGAISDFQHSPKLRSWTQSPTSSLVMVQGTYSSRAQIRNFCVDVIQDVRAVSVPILWALNTGSRSPRVTSPVNVLKSLVKQALQLSPALHSERSLAPKLMSLREIAQPSEMFDLLASALADLSYVYILVDVELLENPSDKASWPHEFLKLFERLAARGLLSTVKVVLVSYLSNVFLQSSRKQDPLRSFVVYAGGTRALPSLQSRASLRPMRLNLIKTSPSTARGSSVRPLENGLI